MAEAGHHGEPDELRRTSCRSSSPSRSAPSAPIPLRRAGLDKVTRNLAAGQHRRHLRLRRPEAQRLQSPSSRSWARVARSTQQAWQDMEAVHREERRCTSSSSGPAAVTRVQPRRGHEGRPTRRTFSGSCHRHVGRHRVKWSRYPVPTRRSIRQGVRSPTAPPRVSRRVDRQVVRQAVRRHPDQRHRTAAAGLSVNSVSCSKSGTNSGSPASRSATPRDRAPGRPP